MIYLGNFALVDTDETDNDVDNPSVLLGVHDDLALVTITQVDEDDDGVIYDDENNPANDFINYDLGSGAASYFVDASMIYTATITLGDGTTVTDDYLVIQTTNGDTFLRTTLSNSDSLDNTSIQSIELTSAQNTNGAGFFTSESVDNASIVCFAEGTQIATPSGEVAVETLKSGMRVLTQDHGPQEITWVHVRSLFWAGPHAPILFKPGALGPGIPSAPLALSPQHRVRLRSKIAKRMFAADEIFVPAKRLLDWPGVRRGLRVLPVTYVHFACRHHEIVFANGAAVETFFPGPQVSDILPGKVPPVAPPQLARPEPRGHAQRSLLRRHLKNRRFTLT
ncbi:Hint domain-containing protein [Litoreibacter ponti]|uniref:Hint domain-containing protein n=2 Tax=Litoreibacter ponti TaxID=1510457 RepID=A0A2T6BIJ1_9RHOB|nr:Hint domain-containing protein [Litoreibacter ponti]